MVVEARALRTGTAWNRFATEQSKYAIFVWLIAGGIHQAYVGRFFSWPTALLFLPGIFVVSFAAVPVSFINLARLRYLEDVRSGRRSGNAIALLFWTVWALFDLAFPALFAILMLRLIQGLTLI